MCASRASKFIAIGVPSGDAFFFQRGGKAFLVDGGGSAEHFDFPKKVRSVTGRKNLDVLICTHNDGDHVRGLLEFLKSDHLNAGQVWLPAIWLSNLKQVVGNPGACLEALVTEVAQSELSDEKAQIFQEYADDEGEEYSLQSREMDELQIGEGNLRGDDLEPTILSEILGGDFSVEDYAGPMSPWFWGDLIVKGLLQNRMADRQREDARFVENLDRLRGHRYLLSSRALNGRDSIAAVERELNWLLIELIEWVIYANREAGADARFLPIFQELRQAIKLGASQPNPARLAKIKNAFSTVLATGNIALQMDSERLAMLGGYIEAARNISEMAVAVERSQTPIRWLLSCPYEQAMPVSGIEQIRPMNAREVAPREYLAKVEPLGLREYLGRSRSDQRSLVFFAPNTEDEPGVLFASDSSFTFLPTDDRIWPADWAKDGSIITAPNHGAGNGHNSCQRLRDHLVASHDVEQRFEPVWIRSAGDGVPGNWYLTAPGFRHCTSCSPPRSNQKPRSVRLRVVSNRWQRGKTMVMVSRCRCRQPVMLLIDRSRPSDQPCLVKTISPSCHSGSASRYSIIHR